MSGLAPVLVTGGAGFIGSNVADRLAAQGRPVRVFDALARPGVELNLEWLLSRHGGLIEPVIAPLADTAALNRAVEGAEAVFHFAAQVAVTTSLADPADDFAVNAAGTFALLEAVRTRAPDAALLYASTNKVYGDLQALGTRKSVAGYVPAEGPLVDHGLAETQPLDFHTPYGCSKGAADQYVLDYARSFGLRAAVLRMSCIYGQRQMGTEDQGWVAHFLIRALRGETLTVYGDGWQVRDICDVADTVDAYLAAWAGIDAIAGRAFNWGGGTANAVSLNTLIGEVAAVTGERPQVSFAPWREGDQRWFVADTRSIDCALGLPPRKPWREGLRDLARWLQEQHALALVSAPAPAARASA